MLTCLDRLPTAPNGGDRVRGCGRNAASNTKQVFEIGKFVAKRNAVAQRLSDTLLVRVRIRPEQRPDHFVLGEILSKKLTDVAGVQVSQAIQFNTVDCSLAKLHLGNGWARNPHLLGDLFLGQSACFTRSPKPAA